MIIFIDSLQTMAHNEQYIVALQKAIHKFVSVKMSDKRICDKKGNSLIFYGLYKKI